MGGSDQELLVSGLKAVGVLKIDPRIGGAVMKKTEGYGLLAFRGRSFHTVEWSPY